MKRTYQPKKRQEQKEHGFMKRMKTASSEINLPLPVLDWNSEKPA